MNLIWTLSFAVDYSGSMRGEIQALKKKIIQIVTSTIGSDSEPADYVLSLFSDPGKSQIDNKKGTIHDTG
jgi:hypothetical protein